MNKDELRKQLLDPSAPLYENIAANFWYKSKYDDKIYNLNCFNSIQKDLDNIEKSVDEFIIYQNDYIHQHWDIIDEKGISYHNFKNGVFKDAYYGKWYKCADFNKPAIYLGSRVYESKMLCNTEQVTKQVTTHLLLIPTRLNSDEYKIHGRQHEYGCDKMSIEEFNDDGQACIGNYWDSVNIIGDWENYDDYSLQPKLDDEFIYK